MEQEIAASNHGRFLSSHEVKLVALERPRLTACGSHDPGGERDRLAAPVDEVGHRRLAPRGPHQRRDLAPVVPGSGRRAG